MLVLVGPKGSGKKWLSRKLVQNFPNFFGLAISHTDQPTNIRNKSSSESSDDKVQDSYQRETKDEFESMRMKGCFLQTCKIGGYKMSYFEIPDEITRQKYYFFMLFIICQWLILNTV